MHTLSDLRQHYDRVHAQVEIKPSTRRGENAIWRQLLEILGADRPVAEITKRDMLELKAAMGATPVHANRALALLSHAFNLAEDWGWRPPQSNPCHRVKRYKEKPRTRLPSIEETARLVQILYSWREEHPHFVGLVLLLMLTGCRRMEIQGAKRAWFQGDRLVLPDSKTGSKIIPLNRQAQAVVAAIPAVEGNPWLIVGRLPGAHLHTPRKLWAKLLKEAGIEDLHIHDLRRLFASVAISSGQTLEQAMQLMGHTQAQTTKRYAFLMSQSKIDAMQATGDELMNMVKKSPALLAGQV
jgi:integrase